MSCLRASSGIEWLRPLSCSSSSVIPECRRWPLGRACEPILRHFADAADLDRPPGGLPRRPLCGFGRTRADREHDSQGHELQHLLRRRRAQPADAAVLQGPGRVPGDARPGRSRDPCLGRRRRRPAGADDEHAHDRGEARLELQRAHVVHVALPDHRSARRERALRLRRAGAGARRRGGERPPPRRPLRALRGARRRHAGRGAAARERPACAGRSRPRSASCRGSPRRASPSSSPATSTRPRTSTGLLLSTRCAPMFPTRSSGRSSKALADAGFVDSFRSVYPNPVARPGFTLDAGLARGREGRGARPHRLGALRWGRRRRPRAASSARPGTRTSTSPSIRGPRITAASSPPSTSRRPRCRFWPRSSRGAWSRGRRSASASMPRGEAGEERVAPAQGRRGPRRHEVDRRRSRRDALVPDRRSSSRRLPGQARRSGRRGDLPVAVLALPAWRDDDGLDEQVALQGRRAHPRLVEEGSRDEVGLARRLQRGRRARTTRTTRRARPATAGTATTWSTRTPTRPSKARRPSRPRPHWLAGRPGRSARVPTRSGC